MRCFNSIIMFYQNRVYEACFFPFRLYRKELFNDFK